MAYTVADPPGGSTGLGAESDFLRCACFRFACDIANGNVLFTSRLYLL